MNLKKIILTVSLIFVFLPLYAEYNDSVVRANWAYTQKDYKTALEWYKKAYREKPSERLKRVIFNINQRLRLQNAPPGLPAIAYEKEKERPFPVGPVLLITANILAAGGAGYAIYSEEQQVKAYNKTYDAINKTTLENYNELLDLQEKTYNMMILKASVVTVFGTIFTYTIVDLFMTHKIFGQDVSLTTGDGRAEIQLSVQRSF